MRFQNEQSGNNPLHVDVDFSTQEEDYVKLLDLSKSPTQLKPIVETAVKGMKKGIAPELCEEGVGGTYFLRDEQSHKVGVFKPLDEEPYHVNNPKGYAKRRNSFIGIKSGILIGEASLRECAAYLLDHDHFAGVPATDLVLCKHPAFFWNESAEEEDNEALISLRNSLDIPKSSSSKLKIGSLQAFVEHDGDCEDIDRRVLSRFPVDEVHKIAQLDIRLFNTDRHGGNILYQEVIDEETGVESYELIPIDHGFTLPSTLDEAWFEWMNWPQSHEKMSQKTLDYISKIDINKDIALLQEKFGDNIREEHLRTFRMSSLVLKHGAVLGLTLHQIGSILVRPDHHTMSPLEILVDQIQNKYRTFASEPSSPPRSDDTDIAAPIEDSFQKALQEYIAETFQNSNNHEADAFCFSPTPKHWKSKSLAASANREDESNSMFLME